MIQTTYTREKDTEHTIYMCHYVLFSGMANKKTHLTIKASRSRKKDLRLRRRKEAPLIPRSCVKWPSLLDVIASPQISVKTKQQTSPIKLTDRKRTFLWRSPGSPLCKGTPHGRQKVRPTPSKSPATKRLRGSSARSLFSTETCDDTFEAFPLVFTDQQLAIVGECNVSSNSHNNYDPRAPQMSDTLQSFQFLKFRSNKKFRKWMLFSPMYSKLLKNPLHNGEPGDLDKHVLFLSVNLMGKVCCFFLHGNLWWSYDN